MKFTKLLLAIFSALIIYIIIWVILSYISLLPLFEPEDRIPAVIVQIWAVFVAAACAIQFSADLYRDVNKKLLYFGFLIISLISLFLLTTYSCLYHFESLKDKVDFYVSLVQMITTFLGAWYGKSKI